MTDNITKLPIRAKGSPKMLEVVSPYGGCQHLHAIVDRKLNELECADCHAKINPIEFCVSIAAGLTGWEYELSQITKARAELEERKKCRCTKCGQMTEIRRGRATF
jgi:hypothetical protein